MQQSPNKPSTFRIRGIPLDWNKSRLRSWLEQQDSSSGPSIKSFALETDRLSYSATVVFRNLPFLTQGPKPWDISLDGPPGTQSPNGSHLSIDNDFLGLTTLFSPSPGDHKVDMIAVGDINGNPIQSYEEAEGNHVWLRDILPSQLPDRENHQPMVRVMAYGYQSVLERNDGLVTFEDLGKALLGSLATLGNSSNTKPIILIGHGVGGLIMKQALISLFKSGGETEKNLFDAIRGVVFFGVPHDGMDITSLELTAAGDPNRRFVESLRQGGSESLNQMHNEFIEALDQKRDTEIFSFYGTLESSITQQDAKPRTGVVVTRASATHCRPWEDDGQHTCAIPRTHADIARFEPHDPEYDNVRNRLLGLSQRAANLEVSV